MAELENAQVRQWAVKGAEQRLLEIAAEAAAIYQTFPELRERGGNQAGKRGVEAATATAGGRGRGRPNMSAAQRKAVSERMRKYWAARREGTVGGTSSGTAKRGRRGAAAAKGDGAEAAAGGRRGPRKMSAAARKRISDAQKKRWAESRKAKS
jgi:hypothetical protein